MEMVHVNMNQVLRRCATADIGQDLLEYALLVGLIVVVAITGVTSVGTTIRDVFWGYISSVKF